MLAFMTTRLSSIIGWICIIIVAVILLPSAVIKLVLTPGSPEAAMMAELGVWDLRHLYAVLEFLCAILLLWPRTSTIGFVLTVGYLGGALATVLTHGRPLDTIPILVGLAFLTLGGFFRNRELLCRLLKQPCTTF